jgi:hypothetical protein
VDDGIDVWTVDAHPERIRRAHHRQRSGGKRVLHPRALVVLEARTITAEVEKIERGCDESVFRDGVASPV